MKNRIPILGLVLLLLAALLVGCDSGKTEPTETKRPVTTADPAKPSADPSGAPPETAEADPFLIETPCCMLAIPSDLEGKVLYEIIGDESFSVAFRTAEEPTPFLTFGFDQKYDTLLGTMVSEEGNRVVYVQYAELSGDELDTYAAYQERIVNTALAYLISEYGFVVGEAIPAEETATFPVETSLVTLRYPAKWREKVRIEVSDTGAAFSCDGRRLFDIVFAPCDGDLIGTMNGTPVYLISYEIEQGALTDDQFDELCAMQEDMNVVLFKLMEEPGFEPAS